MIGLLCVHAVSDIINSGWSWSIPFRIYGEWCVAYLAGRLAFHNLATLSIAAPVGLAVAMLLAVGGIIQATTEINLWELVYGERFLDGISRTMHRWGMLRSWGPCGHPIYFGLLQVAFLPWVLRFWQLSKGTNRSPVAWLCIVIAGLGIVASTSRGPILAAVFTILLSIYALSKNYRPILLTAATAVLVLAGVFQTQIFAGLHRWAGEKMDAETNRTVTIEGETLQITSTAYRVHILKVYKDSVIKAGLLGFGTESVTGFPINIPVDAETLLAIQSIKLIDNEYVLLALRFGWLGVLLFTVSIVLAVTSWFRRASHEGWMQSSWCAFSGAALASIALCMITVWMPIDVGFPVLLLMGSTSMHWTKDW